MTRRSTITALVSLAVFGGIFTAIDGVCRHRREASILRTVESAGGYGARWKTIVDLPLVGKVILITGVGFDRCRVSKDLTEVIARSDRLDFLDLSICSIEPSALANLPSSLRELRLGRTTICNDDLKLVARCKSLEVLHVCQTQIGDAGLNHLRALTNLKKLCAEGCDNVSDVGVAYLRDCRSLKQLRIGGPRVTRKGLVNAMNEMSLQEAEIRGRFRFFFDGDQIDEVQRVEIINGVAYLTYTGAIDETPVNDGLLKAYGNVRRRVSELLRKESLARQ